MGASSVIYFFEVYMRGGRTLPEQDASILKVSLIRSAAVWRPQANQPYQGEISQMTNSGIVARLSAAAAVMTMAFGLSAQMYPNPSSTSGAGNQPNGAAGNQSNGMGPAMTPTDNMAANAQKDADKDFVRKAIMGNHAEVDAGKLALQKSNNADVKNFAQKMVDDHTAMLNDMNKVADELHIKAPQSASGKDKAEAAKMSALSGSAFDSAYVKAMVKDHKKDVAELTKESNSASIPEVKDAATKALPIVEGHLEMIQGIEKNLASSGSATAK
jgi:putative membrane protein